MTNIDSPRDINGNPLKRGDEVEYALEGQGVWQKGRSGKIVLINAWGDDWMIEVRRIDEDGSLIDVFETQSRWLVLKD